MALHTVTFSDGTVVSGIDDSETYHVERPSAFATALFTTQLLVCTSWIAGDRVSLFGIHNADPREVVSVA